jgi:integrase
MARRPRAAELETRTARLKLPVRKKPFFVTIAPGIAVGYRRNQGAGRWIARAADGHGGNWTKAFAIADDFEDADGEQVLTFWEAQDRARALARSTDGNGDRPATVGEALDHYEADLRSRGGDVGNVRRVRLHLPAAFAARTVSLLGARELRMWRNGLVKKGLEPASADRSARALKAALNLASRDDPRITNSAAWRSGLARLPDSERANNIVLPDATIRNVVVAAPAFGREFALFVEVAAVTGARTSQLLRLKVRDLHDDVAAPRLMMPSSRKGRRRSIERKPLPISPTLATALRRAAVGRPDDAPLLPATAPQPHRIFPRLVAQLELDSAVTLYSLRHSSITRMLLSGVPVRVVAAHHDTSIAMLEKTYSRFIGEHSDVLVRAALLDLEQPPAGDKVVSLPRAGERR